MQEGNKLENYYQSLLSQIEYKKTQIINQNLPENPELDKPFTLSVLRSVIKRLNRKEQSCGH